MSDVTRDPAPIEGQDATPDGTGQPSPRRRRGRAFALALLAVLGITVALVVAVLMIFLRRQSVSYVTRWIRPPQESVPYEALPAQPELHLVAVSDPEGQLRVLGMSGRFWSEERGDVLLVGLDSNRLDDAQLGWLDGVLGNSDATWKIVALHHPPYSAGYQGSSLRTRERVAPVPARNGVQLVLSGHDHDWQRSNTIDGVNYVVTGSGSGTRRTGAEDFTANSFAWLGFADIGVYPDRLLVRSVSEDLDMSDMVEIAPDGTVTELGANG